MQKIFGIDRARFEKQPGGWSLSKHFNALVLLIGLLGYGAFIVADAGELVIRVPPHYVHGVIVSTRVEQCAYKERRYGSRRSGSDCRAAIAVTLADGNESAVNVIAARDLHLSEFPDGARLDGYATWYGGAPMRVVRVNGKVIVPWVDKEGQALRKVFAALTVALALLAGLAFHAWRRFKATAGVGAAANEASDPISGASAPWRAKG